MTVKDFVEASYTTMVFRDHKALNKIYYFTWEDGKSEDYFLAVYGKCEVKKFTSHRDGIINVYIDTDI